MTTACSNFGLVSIVMPAYNSEPFIEESIRSVQSQTYGDWELLIVDDCSTDKTISIANEIACGDSRIHVFQNKQNSGAAYSRNRALREAKGDWIAFLDSDDLWDKEKLAKQLSFMRDNRCGFSYTKYETVDEEGRPLQKSFSGPARIDRVGMRCYCWPGCLTVMYDTRIVGVVQIANLKKHNDYAMWLNVIDVANCLLLPEVLGRYRVRSSSISHGTSKLIQAKYLYKLWNSRGCFKATALCHAALNIACSFYKKIRYVHSF